MMLFLGMFLGVSLCFTGLIASIVWIASGESDANGSPEQDAQRSPILTTGIAALPTDEPEYKALCSDCDRVLINGAAWIRRATGEYWKARNAHSGIPLATCPHCLEVNNQFSLRRLELSQPSEVRL